jgi:phage terminase large subunit-like protein
MAFLDVMRLTWCPPKGVGDCDVIRDDIKELAETYAIVEIGHDRWNATQLVTQLMGDGAEMVPIGQGFADLSAPSRELEQLVRDVVIDELDERGLARTRRWEGPRG